MDFGDYLLQTYGPSVANRYRQIANRPTESAPIRTERWISNTIHREKGFNSIQCAVIRSQHNAGYSCRDLAREWGVSQGTISNVLRGRGSYR
jgi:hypothetical protein